METDKRKEVINAFLETFVQKGLADTTSRDLAKSLQLQSGGLYYYFESKDAAVIACAEEAVNRLEEKIIVPAINEVEYPERMIKNTQIRADEMASTMKFLAQVCSSPKYAPKLNESMGRLFERYKYYATKASKRLGCEFDEIAPYVYMGFMVASHYMIFGMKEYVSVQVDVIRYKLNELIANNETRMR